MYILHIKKGIQINGIIIQISILVMFPGMFPYSALICHKPEWHPFKQALQGTCFSLSLSLCVHAVCGIWCLGLSGCGESYESSLCNWNVMRTGEEFDWTGAFSHAPTSPRQMSNSFPNEKWHSPEPIPPPPPSSVLLPHPSPHLSLPPPLSQLSRSLWFLPAYLQSNSD